MNAPRLPDPEDFLQQLLGFNKRVLRLENSRYFSCSTTLCDVLWKSCSIFETSTRLL